MKKIELTNITIEKINLEICIKSFEENLKQMSIEDLVKTSYKLELENLNIRGIVWKIFLDCLHYDNSSNINLYDWIKTTQVLRSNYQKHKSTFQTRRHFTSDPLDILNV
jgi:exosome complex RNA-binding protein Rrp42 (RNase PH superfamily)